MSSASRGIRISKRVNSVYSSANRKEFVIHWENGRCLCVTVENRFYFGKTIRNKLNNNLLIIYLLFQKCAYSPIEISVMYVGQRVLQN